MTDTKNRTQKETDFIMFPTVDVCFAGLMENPIVRKGFCGAIMGISPEMIGETELLPTHTRRENVHDKLGILDVLVKLKDGTRINMEMQLRYFEFWDERALFYLSKMFAGQLELGDSYEKLQKCIHVSILDFVRFPEDEKCYRTIHFRDDESKDIYNDKMELKILELRKLPKEVKTGEEIVNWMRFLNGKSREEFELMAGKNEYLGEAYEALQRLSADDRRRLEYEERDKALKDYNTQMNSARRQGQKIGEEIGEKRGEEIGEKRGQKIGEEIGINAGIQLTLKVLNLYAEGKTAEEIMTECGTSIEKVRMILQNVKDGI